MKFSINQSELNASLSVVSKGAASRSTLPVLSGILIKAKQDVLVLESTDMDQSIRCTCSALIEEEGQTVVPAKLLNDVVKSLPDAAIHFSQEEDAATILCDTSSFSLKTLAAEDFPGFPEVDKQTSITIPFKSFSTMVKRVARVVSRDDSRPILSGVMIEVEQGKMKMVATDSYRLALDEETLDQTDATFSAVIAGSFLNDLASLPGENESIELGLSENQIIANYGSYTFINRRIEGNYPNYNQLLPQDFATTATFDVKQLLEASKRVSLVSNNTSPIRFDVSSASQTTQLSSTTQDLGAAQETIASEINGEDVQIAFNCHYLIDGLNALPSQKVQLNLQGGVKPGIFKDVEGSYLYLIMPVRLS